MARALADQAIEYGPTLAWGRLLMQYRAEIIARYLDAYEEPGREPEFRGAGQSRPLAPAD